MNSLPSFDKTQDPLDTYEKALTCPFCRSKFSGGVKLIPDCGKCICDACYDDLKRSDSKVYRCLACGQSHVLPENELPNCALVLDLLRQPIEKPLSQQARKLKRLVENLEDEMALSSCRAAESAVKHINKIEADLRKQIQMYRLQCLNTIAAESPKYCFQIDQNRASSMNRAASDQRALAKDVRDFSAKWNDYFKRLNSSASESELEAAVSQTDFYRARIRTLDQEMRNGALGNMIMQFNPKASFHSARDHLGRLVEVTTKNYQKKTKGESHSTFSSFKTSTRT